MKIYRIIILLSLIGFSENLFSQESDSSKAITYSALYTTDFVGFKNSNSDLQSGMLGHIDLSMELNTESLGLWKNGTTMIYIINDHGSNPTANSVGDIQTFSNIEAPARTKLYECWYEQQMGDLSIKIGQQNVNGEFVFSETGLNLINSAFGVIPTVSSNIPISIFPNTSIGIRGIYSVTPNWNILVGVFDGEPGDETNDPYGYNWEISKNEGAIMLVESQNSIIDKTTDEIKATIKLGYWHSSSEFEDIVSGDKEKGNFGLYTIDDFVISRNVQNPDLGWRGFIQGGWSPNTTNFIQASIGGGISLIGVRPERDDEVFSIGYTNALIHKEYVKTDNTISGEHVIEINYGKDITDNIRITPDFQYIINTGGVKSRNTIVGLIRASIDLSN